jgi:L-alanine-DL-glutamate epimerase-like enolase superfamily enzyme
VRIVEFRTTVVGAPRRELTFVELVSDDGLTGVGEVRMVNKTRTLLACVQELAPRYVLGADPFDVERLAWNVQLDREACLAHPPTGARLELFREGWETRHQEGGAVSARHDDGTTARRGGG